MSKGMRGMLAVAACLAGVTAGFAGEPAAAIHCKVCVLRLSDECVEKLARCQAEECPFCGSCPAASTRPKSCCADEAAGNCCRRDQGCPTKCTPEARAGKCCSADCFATQATTPAGCPGPMVLKPGQANRWVQLARAGKGCEVVCCPNVTVVSGQTARVRICSPTISVSGRCPTQERGEECDNPAVGTAMNGCSITIRAMANLDNQSVTVSLSCRIGDNPNSETRNSKSDCCPSGCCQKPCAGAACREMSRTFACPTGCTVVLEAGRKSDDRGCDSEVPFLGDLPVVGELFRCKSCAARCNRLLVLVTPTVCGDGDGEESSTDSAANPAVDVPLFAMPVMCGDWQPVASPPAVTQWMAGPPVAVARCLPPAPPMAMEFLPVMPRVVAGQPLPTPVPQAMVRPAACPAPGVPSSPDAELVNLMIEYYEACAAGENIKARNLAARCIAIDPTCFAR